MAGVEAVTEPSIADATSLALEKPLPHKLERMWTFWFDNQSKPKQGAAWGTSLRSIYTFDTVEDFWCLYDQIFKPSKLTANADFHLFKAGIEPKWEDPECANGGKWTITCGRKAILDAMWLETLMSLIDLTTLVTFVVWFLVFTKGRTNLHCGQQMRLLRWELARSGKRSLMSLIRSHIASMTIPEGTDLPKAGIMYEQSLAILWRHENLVRMIETVRRRNRISEELPELLQYQCILIFCY